MLQELAFGFKGEKTIQSWKEKFDCYYDNDDNAFFISKDIFTSTENVKIRDFNYQYVIECYAFKDKWYYLLSLVVCPESLDSKILEDVADSCGMDKRDVEICDVCLNGLYVCFGIEVIEGDKLNHDVLTNIANVFETMDSMRGFYLDKNTNGSYNGWDILRRCVEGNDIFKIIC